MTLIETNQKVILIHRGFDICIIQLPNGTQKLVKPYEIGLKPRVRPSTLIKKQKRQARWK